jgi:alkaline phosphatase
VKAIKMLGEGGRIDHAHYDNFANHAWEETEEFARVIDVARRMTNEEETLIVVTVDHSHTLSFRGYAKRGSDVHGR